MTSHVTSTPTADQNYTSSDNSAFWKSQSMDSINQLLQGCTNINLPLTPVGSDIKIESAPSSSLILSSSGNCNTILPSRNPTYNSVQSSSSSSCGSASSVPTPLPISLSSGFNTPSSIPATPQIPFDTMPSPIQPIENNPPLSQLVTSNSTTSLTPSSTTMVNFQAAPSNINYSREVVRVEKEPTYVDVTPFLILPQHEAARRLGVPCSTLSKRWKEASVNRKWPYRIVCKLDKEITTLLKNVENNSGSGIPASLSPVIEENLGHLLRKRQEELRTVVIRIN